MLYFPKIGDYFKIVTDEEVKNFVAINLSEYCKSTREKLFSKLSEEQNLRNVTEWLYIFITTPVETEKFVEIMPSNYSDNCVQRYNIEILNLFDPELQLQLVYTKPVIKNKLKELLSELRKFKVRTL